MGSLEEGSEGNKTEVVLSIDDYERILEELEELEAIRAFDAAKSSGDDAIPADGTRRTAVALGARDDPIAEQGMDAGAPGQSRGRPGAGRPGAT